MTKRSTSQKNPTEKVYGLLTLNGDDDLDFCFDGKDLPTRSWIQIRGQNEKEIRQKASRFLQEIQIIPRGGKNTCEREMEITVKHAIREIETTDGAVIQGGNRCVKFEIHRPDVYDLVL